MTQKKEEQSLAIDCSIHQDCLADMFCIEPQCFNQGLICTQCYLDSHSDHQFCTTTELAFKLSQLINLSKQNGAENFEQKLTNIQGIMLTVTQQLSETIDIFKKKLQQIKSAFERYRTISSDVSSISDFISILKGNGNPAQYRDNLQDLLQKISLKGRLFVLNQAEQLQNQQLFIPNDNIVTDCLEPLIDQIKNFNKKCSQQLQQGDYYEKLDLNFPFGLTLLAVDKKDIIPNPEQLRGKTEIVAQRYQIFRETHVLNNKKLIPIIDQAQQEIREGTERIEKVFLINGLRIWYKDLIYTKFRAKNWTIEPRSACMICKCHPRFARIREFLDVKYGELYGPINHDKMIYHQYKQALTQHRPELTYIIDKTSIYLHDLCTYWSTNVKSDEERGTIDFNSFAQAIKVSQEQKCHLCKRIGATLKCNYSTCDIWIHYYCFRNLDAEEQHLDDDEKFRIRCWKHKTNSDSKPQWYLNQEKEQLKPLGPYIHKEEFNVIDFANNLQVERKNNAKVKNENQNKFEV